VKGFKITFIGFVYVLFLVAESACQGFNVFNNRNHPHLNWQVAETEHFEIIYPERISGIETEAASIAEESYRALSENMGVTFSSKIRIYLADMDEIANGFANPIGKGYTMIWVNLNDYSVIKTGRLKWMRSVIAHELGHIFHFKAVWSKMGLLNYALGTPTPLFWTEGIAQYQAEVWNSERGDRWLRKAIFDSRPDFRRRESIEDGRLMYAAGQSQVLYFTEKYGDSTLVDMLKHRNKRLGLFEYHDFYEAFDEYVDGGYNSFYEDWLKHINIHYYTIASQMERVDSLGTDAVEFPGQFYFDMAVSPDESRIALLSLESLRRPVRSLYIVKNDSTNEANKIAEGSIRDDLNWSRDGNYLYYSRLTRGEKSEIVNDIFRLDMNTGRENQITFSRRARFPVEGPGDHEISYIVNEGGTGNLVTLDTKTGIDIRLTNYTGDVQLHWPVWIESQNKWLLYRFDKSGNRNLILFNPQTGKEIILDYGEFDNRKPVLSPDERKIAFTSLRDEVPNVFVYHFESGETRRVTHLFTGGEVYGWIAASDTVETDKLLIKASETKRRDYLFWVDASRTVAGHVVEPAKDYASWKTKTPPNQIPQVIEPDESLILNRTQYRPLSNITHAASFALPYYTGPDNWGVFATSNWTEPLGKHIISALGWISASQPKKYSYGTINYVNNNFYPTSAVSFYRMPGQSHYYGNRFLVQELTGGEWSLTWPVDMFDKPYQFSSFGLRIRHIQINPLNRDRFEDLPDIPQPVKGRQTDIALEWTIKKQRPWSDNTIHPLDGRGVKISLNGAEKILGSDVSFLRADINTYAVLPAIGLQRIYIQARYQQVWGRELPQNYIGFSRYDNISLSLPDQVFIRFFQDTERVRGYRSFIAGKQVLFGSIEYRVPFLPSLETKILGIAELGSTAINFFTDAGVIWKALFSDGENGTERRWGAGAEVRNELRLFGIGVSHSLGIAQPMNKLFEDDTYDLYYRVRAVVPF
jgi:hypothetical protein